LLPLLFNRAYYEIECVACREKLESDWLPVILDLSDIGLLVFATPGVDDGRVATGFTHYSDPVVACLDNGRRQRFAISPFTIVYGACGLASLLCAFGTLTPRMESKFCGEGGNWRPRPFWKCRAGLPKMWNVPRAAVGPSCDVDVTIESDPAASQIRILHAAENKTSIQRLDGYWYGELFFFYSKQLLVRPVVHVFLALTETAPDRAAQEELYGVFGQAPFADLDHPWVLQELGRLAIDCDPKASSSFLERALRAQHAWLAVTANVLDATPRRRQLDDAVTPTLSASELKRIRAVLS